MESRDGALLAVRLEIGGEPFALRDVTGASAALVRRGRRRLARGPLRRAVQHDHVPCTEIVAVVPDRRRRPRTKVAEVPRGGGSQVLVIARRGPCAALVPPPRRLIAQRIIWRRSKFIRVVPDRD